MMKNEDVARAFVNMLDLDNYPRTENMFVELENGRRVIYSYGHHFPIAMRISNGKYLFNEDGYSNTTAHHKSLVKSYIPDHAIILVSTSELKEAIASDGVIVLKREKQFEDAEQLQSAIENYYKSKGVNTLRIRNRITPFIKEMERTVILSEV